MRVGILGAGQLAQMMAHAAKRMEHTSVLCLDPTEKACAGLVTDHKQASYDDEEALKQFAEKSDVITIETENIPLKTLDFLSSYRKIYPSRLALSTSQDRLYEKSLCRDLDIPTPKFFQVDSFEDFKGAVEELNFEAILKTRRLGYDGKGQFCISAQSCLEELWEKMPSKDLIAEEKIFFDYEVSMISVRSIQGEEKFYPLVRNYHEGGILRYSIAPWDQASLFERAKEIVKKLLEKFSYVGIFTVEFFVKEGDLLVNEMAPRVHNSGHWTIEGAKTSQFENHLRACCSMTLGSTESIGKSIMFNHIGHHPKQDSSLSQTYTHDYGKEPKPQRKIGHTTLSSHNEKAFLKTLISLQEGYPRYEVLATDLYRNF